MAYNNRKLFVLAAILVSTSGLSLGTTCGAKPLIKPAAPVDVSPSTPELSAANDRVRQAKAQWDIAKKQVDAARALLRAAEADYRAAVADREALALKTTAQGLADASGLVQSSAAKPKSVPADVPAQVAAPVAAPVAAAPAPAQDLSQTRIQQNDFNAEPSDPIQLR
jgi:hypothetical protein